MDAPDLSQRFQKSIRLLHQGDNKEAIEILKGIVTANPGHADAHETLIKALQHYRNGNDLLPFLEAYAKEHPTSSYGQYYLASLLLGQSLSRVITLLMKLLSQQDVPKNLQNKAGELLMYARLRLYEERKKEGRLPELYDRDYFQQSCGDIPYNGSHDHWPKFFGAIADQILSVCKPQRVLDAGCAKGFLVHELQKRGVAAYGFDISDYAINDVHPDIKSFCRVGSVLDPIREQYDLIVSIEVVEHLSDEDGRAAIENMCKHAKQILFSSTGEDFFERTHVNVRPLDYWNRLFAAFHFYPDDASDWRSILSPFGRLYVERNPLKEETLILRSSVQEKDNLLQLKNQHIGNIEEHIRNQDQVLHDQAKAIQLKNQHIGNIEDALSQTSVALEAERALTQKQKQHIQNISADLEIKTTSLRTLEAQYQTLSGEKHILQEKNAVLTMQQTNLQRDLGLSAQHIRNIESALAHTQQTLESIYRSRSWKVIHCYATLKKLFLATLWTLRHEGVLACFQKVFHLLRKQQENMNAYQRWIKKNTPSAGDRRKARDDVHTWKTAPPVSILLPIADSSLPELFSTVSSLQQQWYTAWELCIAGPTSLPQKIRQKLDRLSKHDSRIHAVLNDSSQEPLLEQARQLAHGDLLLPLHCGDRLAPDALYHLARSFVQHPATQIIYTDEDVLDASGKRTHPYFKPDFSPDLLLSTMYMGHVCYAQTLFKKIGGFRPGFAGSEEYDLALRATEHCESKHIVHLPRVLLHVRHEHSLHVPTGKNALEQTLKRRGIHGAVVSGIAPCTLRVRRVLPKKPPLVSIIIPTTGVSLLRTCLESILAMTTYPNYELIVVLNNSKDRDGTLAYLSDVQKRFPACRVIEYKKPFNFSDINNVAACEARGDLLLFLNDDTEPITEEWLSAMVEQAQRKEVGAVGAKLIYPNNTIQHAGVVLGIGGVAGHAHKYLPHLADEHGYRGLLNVIRNYSAVTAACLMTRRDVFTQVHGFDETLAVAFNDVDLCLRIRKAGYHVVYTPYAVLYHYESISRGKALNQKEVALMQERWGDLLQNDPFYNPHLSRTHEDFRLAV